MSRILTVITLVLIVMGCDSKLSEEQRKALRTEMEDRKIKKISPDQIYNKALEEGQKLVAGLDESSDLDSIKSACSCDVIFAENSTGLTDKEKAVYEAYNFDATTAGNLQKDNNEVLTYASPLVVGDSLMGVWFIRFDKSEIVKGL